MVRKQVTINTIHEHNNLLYNQPKEGYKTNEEHKRTHQSKDVHWFLTKVREEPKRQQVKITIEETIDTKL